eukprot:GHVS01038479.1.p1 GENE.GHVS01038479.1~~GHVS01038479.1.p1  ORF type:complete len:112 (+),score=6.79 GHVS01038479.1:418-753(+)
MPHQNSLRPHNESPHYRTFDQLDSSQSQASRVQHHSEDPTAAQQIKEHSMQSKRTPQQIYIHFYIRTQKRYAQDDTESQRDMQLKRTDIHYQGAQNTISGDVRLISRAVEL